MTNTWRGRRRRSAAVRSTVRAERHPDLSVVRANACGGGVLPSSVLSDALNRPLIKVWCALPARVLTGWKPVPHEKASLFQQAVRGRAKLAGVYAASLLASAAALAFCLSTEHFPWLGWLALLPLFAAIRTLHPRMAAIFGAGWGVALYVFSAYVFTTEVAAGCVEAVLITIVPCAYCALGAYLTRRIGFSPLILGVGWMVVELALTPIGLRSGLLASARGDVWVLYAAADALGYAMCASLIAWACASLLVVVDWMGACGAEPRTVISAAAAKTLLSSQTFPCFPLMGTEPFRPRGPPVSAGLLR